MLLLHRQVQLLGLECWGFSILVVVHRGNCSECRKIVPTATSPLYTRLEGKNKNNLVNYKNNLTNWDYVITGIMFV